MAEITRHLVTVFSKTITTDVTATTATGYTGRRFKSLRPPYTLVCKTSNVNTAPSGTISIKLILEQSKSASATVWKTTTLETTPITAAGTKSAQGSIGTQLLPYLRVTCTATAGTWAAGTLVVGYLSGEGTM